jgi:hypothetical protein
VKLVPPDSAVPPGPVAVARTVPGPESDPKAAPLRVAIHRLPDPLASRKVVRPPSWIRNVTRSTLPVVPVEMVALVEWRHPERLSMVDGATDGVNTSGRGGRVVVVVVVVVVLVVVAKAGPTTPAAARKATPAVATARGERKWPIPDIVARPG